jgi:hypothetical protein
MQITFACQPEYFDDLPQPLPARAGLPEWLRKMPAEQQVPGWGVDRTVKQCPPFVDAMSYGFIMPLACDIVVEKGVFSWHWTHEASPLGVHFGTQLVGTPFDRDGASALKILNFWAIRTEPGISTLFTHPFNRPDLPFRAATGLVDTDGFHQLPVHFPVLWTDDDFEGVLPRGTPVVQCLPVRRETLEMSVVAFSDQEAAANRTLKADLSAGPGYYRKHFRAARP